MTQIAEFLNANLAEIIFLLVGVVASFFVAKWFGDVAGTRAAIRYEEEKSRRARIGALRALLNQVELIKKLAQANAEGDSILKSCGGLTKLPVQAFETAFVSGEPIASDDRDLLDAVNGYLSEAYIINSVVDVYLSLAGGPGNIQASYASHTVEQVREACNTLPGVLNTLQMCLEASLEEDRQARSKVAA
jgi:hypothetical protein